MLFISIQCKWLPNFSFDRSSFRGLWKYSSNLLASHSITKFIEEGVSFIIGKTLTPYSLGLFTRGLQFATLPNGVIGSVLATVMFPAFSSYKDDKAKFYDVYRRTIISQALFIVPIYLGLAIVSEPLVLLLLGEKWMDVVPVLQIFCLGKSIFSLANTTEHVLCALGYSNLALNQQLFKMLVKFTLILIAVNWGLMAVVIANAVADFSAYFITNHCGRKYIEYSMVKQIKDVYVYIIFAIMAAGGGYIFCLMLVNVYLKIGISLLVAAFLYMGLVYVFKYKDVRQIVCVKL